MSKKTKQVLGIVIVIVVIFVLFKGYDIYNHLNEKNVFDEIYYSELKLLKGYIFKPNPNIENLEQIEKDPRDRRISEWGTLGTASEFYKDGILGENKSISFVFCEGELEGVTKMLKISYRIKISETVALYLIHEYDVSTKNLHQRVYTWDGPRNDGQTAYGEEIYPYLEEYGVSIDEVIALSNEVLYEIFLPDWFKGNKGHSKFSINNLGDFTITKDAVLEQGN